MGTILWTDKLGDPAYFVTEMEGLELDDDVEFLGGATLAEVRLRLGNGVQKLEKNTWVEESKVDDKGLPDVWFGKTYVVHKEDAVFARLSKGAPYLRIPVTFAKPDTQSIAVDRDGTIWKTEDDVLLSSKKRPGELLVVTEEELVAARKKSILRGGSDDVTGEPPNAFPQSTCRMHYVLLDHSAAAPNKDYAPILRALTGHTEFAAAKFIVHKEGERQFFGAQIKDYELAAKLDVVIEKAIKGADPDIMCAEPTAPRELRVDFAKGKQLP
ncbi:MAG: hypothetical protein HOW73_14600 [Polyangiaceae bacterium]|nr:hypothetical protein [Polyangiaceae bacterium]